ncbi:phosphopantetheine-binding protein [Cytobacillus praedii]|uniref:phosphopantetheine-binding protein n=1 Tax=Cytobacillus praedii TaxID=1742358 RepID=UPI003F7E1DC9
MTIKEKIFLLLSNKGCGVFSVDYVSEEKTLIDLGFDSLRFMELVVQIEEEFSIEIPDHFLEISPETTVNDVIHVVRDCYLDRLNNEL